MLDTTHVWPLKILLDGSPAPPGVFASLTEILVDSSLHLPGVFSLRLEGRDVRVLEALPFDPGTTVEILIGPGRPTRLMVGSVTGLELDMDQSSTILLVRGFDRSYRLHRGRQRRSFAGMTDSELARKLAFESGLDSGTIEATTEVHEYLFQNDQTNAEFLRERARRIGFDLWVQDEALHFRSPARDAAPPRLAWGETLLEFRPRLSVAGRVDTVEVRGWDPVQKRELIGLAKGGRADSQVGASSSPARWAGGAPARLTLVAQPVSSLAEADRLARAVLDEAASAVVEADGVCDPMPALTPGRQIRVDGVGRRFSGTYYVTKVAHHWRNDRRTATYFSASGRRDQGLWSLIEQAGARPAGAGLAVGIVTSTSDPHCLGRVRVRFPWLSDDDESAWVRIASPAASLVCLPEVGGEVLVGFEHGDIHRPFLLGELWNRRDPPPLDSGQTPGPSFRIDIDGDLTFNARGKVRILGEAGVDVNTRGKVRIVGEAGVEVNGRDLRPGAAGANP